MTQDIVYSYVRRATVKIMIASGIALAIMGYIGIQIMNEPARPSSSSDSNGMLIFVGLLIVVGLLFLAGLVMFFVPTLHPAFWRVNRYGSAEEVAAKIDKDAQDYSETLKLSKAGYYATFTPNWIVWSRGFIGTQIRILNLADIAWVYPHTLITNGVAQYSLKVFDRNGKKTDIHLYRNQAMGEQIFRRLEQYAPWIMTGYSADKEAAWERNRQMVLDALDDKLSQHQKSKAQPAR